MRPLVMGFADELEKLGELEMHAGMTRAQEVAFKLLKGLHPKVGGDDPLAAMFEAQRAQTVEQVRRKPLLEWLARALRTGEIARDTVGDRWLGSGKAPMEQVVSLAEPMTQERAALASLQSKTSPLQRLGGIFGDRRAMRTALRR